MAKYLYFLPLITSTVFTLMWVFLYTKFHENTALILAGVGLHITLFMCFLGFILEK